MGARAVAEDFVNHCISGNIGGREGVHPGVMLCAGDEPTEAEIKHCFDTHTRYARWCVNDGHALFQRADHGNITEEHRRQAEWLGVNVPWKLQLERTDTKKCPACATEIFAAALKCNSCQTVLPDFYELMGLSAENDPVVAGIIAARKVKVVAPPVKAVTADIPPSSFNPSVKPLLPNK